ncbi:unnamed protein product [Rhizoctonia solani]|uniref:ATP-citrate synthase ATP-grasp domain-containing protein n=1 Tax=Rhizoctonia solani TaxID=456999 RepID=A0A8H3CLI0_9AGAM|nr:unnamed protein product [Rhizoctonia solani]
MSSKAIREFDAKLLLPCWLPCAPAYAGTEPVTSTFVYPTPKVVQTPRDSDTNTATPDTQLPPFSTEKLVAKPDQLIKRRYDESKAWIFGHGGKPVQVESATGTLNNFIVGPFLPHPSNTEYYICTNSQREGDEILFTHEGGVDIGDVYARAARLTITVNAPFPPRADVKSNLLAAIPAVKLAKFSKLGECVPMKVRQMQEDGHGDEQLPPLPPRVIYYSNLAKPTRLTNEPQVGPSKLPIKAIHTTEMDSG